MRASIEEMSVEGGSQSGLRGLREGENESVRKRKDRELGFGYGVGIKVAGL